MKSPNFKTENEALEDNQVLDLSGSEAEGYFGIVMTKFKDEWYFDLTVPFTHGGA